MATRTSVASGLWSNAGTWDTGVPVNGDTVIIANGHVVEFDVDQSGFANGVDLTITGELSASTSAGSYYLKCSANVDGTGILRAGTSSVEYPASCTFTIESQSFYLGLTGSGSYQLYCAQPTNKYIKLSGAEAAGQVVLSVDTDVTTDIWNDGDTIHINDIDGGRDSEERVIAAGGIAANTITITAGLTNAKITGAYVILITRNVKIFGTGTFAIYNAVDGIIGAQISASSYASYYGFGCVFSGTALGNIAAINLGSGHVLSGTFSGGNSNAVLFGAGHVLSGLFSGNVNAVQSGAGHVLSGLFVGNTNGAWFGSYQILGATFENNTYDMRLVSSARAINTLFNSATEFYEYNASGKNIYDYVESIDHDQVSGAFKAWCKGGIVTSVTSPLRTGRVRSYQFACEDADNPVFMQKEYWVEAGGKLSFTAYAQKDASMSYLPRLWIYEAGSDPLISGSPLIEKIMTDSVDRWEALSATQHNASNSPKLYVARMLAKNTNGNVYFDFEFIDSSPCPDNCPDDYSFSDTYPEWSPASPIYPNLD